MIATWIAVIVGIVCIMIGYLCGTFNKKASDQYIGSIIVDHWHPEINGGVYSVFDVDPQSLKNGAHVAMDVIVADVTKSQEKPGS